MIFYNKGILIIEKLLITTIKNIDYFVALCYNIDVEKIKTFNQITLS